MWTPLPIIRTPRALLAEAATCHSPRAARPVAPAAAVLPHHRPASPAPVSPTSLLASQDLDMPHLRSWGTACTTLTLNTLPSISLAGGLPAAAPDPLSPLAEEPHPSACPPSPSLRGQQQQLPGQGFPCLRNAQLQLPPRTLSLGRAVAWDQQPLAPRSQAPRTLSLGRSAAWDQQPLAPRAPRAQPFSTGFLDDSFAGPQTFMEELPHAQAAAHPLAACAAPSSGHPWLPVALGPAPMLPAAAAAYGAMPAAMAPAPMLPAAAAAFGAMPAALAPAALAFPALVDAYGEGRDSHPCSPDQRRDAPAEAATPRTPTAATARGSSGLAHPFYDPLLSRAAAAYSPPVRPALSAPIFGPSPASGPAMRSPPPADAFLLQGLPPLVVSPQPPSRSLEAFGISSGASNGISNGARDGSDSFRLHRGQPLLPDSPLGDGCSRTLGHNSSLGHSSLCSGSVMSGSRPLSRCSSSHSISSVDAAGIAALQMFCRTADWQEEECTTPRSAETTAAPGLSGTETAAETTPRAGPTSQQATPSPGSSGWSVASAPLSPLSAAKPGPSVPATPVKPGARGVGQPCHAKRVLWAAAASDGNDVSFGTEHGLYCLPQAPAAGAASPSDICRGASDSNCGRSESRASLSFASLTAPAGGLQDQQRQLLSRSSSLFDGDVMDALLLDGLKALPCAGPAAYNPPAGTLAGELGQLQVGGPACHQPQPLQSLGSAFNLWAATPLAMNNGQDAWLGGPGLPLPLTTSHPGLAGTISGAGGSGGHSSAVWPGFQRGGNVPAW